MANYSFQEGKLEIALCNGSKGIMDREGLEHDKILPFLSVVQCYQGYYEIGLDGGPPVPLEEGGLFITRPDQPQQIIHHCRADGSPMRAQWVFFSVISDGFLDITRCLIPKPVLSAQAVENLKKSRETLGADAKILAGIMPVVSQRNAIFMENEINGIHVEDWIIEKFAGLDRAQGEELGLAISLEMAKAALPYADGLYLMTPFNRVALMERLIGRLKQEVLGAY